tara:strand:- start:3938 stop:4402 length:465 start_codon:yes stop_codon:yes gene_type:complete
LIRKKANNAAFYYSRGCAKLAINDYNGANTDFSAALNIKPKHKNALIKKALTSFNMKKYDDAAKEYGALCDVFPDKALYHVNRGIAYLRLNEYNQAVTSFNHAIDVDDKIPEAYFNRANAFSQLNRNDKACKDMRTAGKLGYDAAFEYIGDFCK